MISSRPATSSTLGCQSPAATFATTCSGDVAPAITDATLSEVAKLAQIKLYYSSNSPAYVRSHTALLSLIQALAYGVYAQDSAQYDDRIKAFRLK